MSQQTHIAFATAPDEALAEQIIDSLRHDASFLHGMGIGPAAVARMMEELHDANHVHCIVARNTNRWAEHPYLRVTVGTEYCGQPTSHITMVLDPKNNKIKQITPVFYVWNDLTEIELPLAA